MRTRTLVASMLVASLCSVGSARAEQLLYLASSKAKTIVAYGIDADTGKLTPKHETKLPGNPGPLAFSPDRRLVYAAMTGLEGKKAGVGTLKRADDGSLDFVKWAPITSRAPYIRADKSGRYLLAAHYGAGNVTVYRIVDGICTGELLDLDKTERTAHCIELDPSGRFAFVPHTAPNKVYQFRLDAKTGKLTPNKPPFAVGPDADLEYHAPRHYAHHPKLTNLAYTSNEFGGGITLWKFDEKTGTLSRVQTLSTLPPDYKGNSAAADIHITPDGQFAYVSNRDTNKPLQTDKPQDTLAGFRLDATTGKMTAIGHFPTAHFPRTFCIDQTGRYLYAAGQRSATLFAYRIDPKTGKLEHLETYKTGGTPIWVVCGQTKK